MGVPIVVCGCGRRLKVMGAAPGAIGRCPRCGRELTVPDAADPAPDRPGPGPGAPEGPFAGGYAVGPSARTAGGVGTFRGHPSRARAAVEAPRARTSAADGILGARREPEPWWLPDVAFPLRAADSLGVVAILGVAFWVGTVLVPEYCLTAIRDGEMLGAGLMGRLVALISGLPAVFLLPPACSYGLQYLGRVLASAAAGETVPPRAPDRNFEGFFGGLGRWLAWLLAGVAAGFAPLAFYGIARGGAGIGVEPVGLALALFGFAYALMALPLAFLDDDAPVPMPTRVLGALARLNASFAPVCAIVAAALGLVASAFAAALLLRPKAFWPYLAACLGCWFLANWSAIVAVRVLGNYYNHHRGVFRGRRKRPRRGVASGR